MKSIMIIAFVLLAGSALAADLKLPQLAPKREPVVATPLAPLPETKERCLARITGDCVSTHKGIVSKYLNKACIRRNQWQCKGK